MNKNIRYVTFKTDAQRDALIEDYRIIGYYVTVEGDRIKVNSKHPVKKVVKEEKPRSEDKEDRPKRKFDKRD
jgi:hypothetical protein